MEALDCLRLLLLIPTDKPGDVAYAPSKLPTKKTTRYSNAECCCTPISSANPVYLCPRPVARIFILPWVCAISCPVGLCIHFFSCGTERRAYVFSFWCSFVYLVYHLKSEILVICTILGKKAKSYSYNRLRTVYFGDFDDLTVYKSPCTGNYR